jgi:hypothetical protein
LARQSGRPWVGEHRPIENINMQEESYMLETDFEKLSFEKAVQLFKEWGFLVQQGPRTSEVTLILEGPTHRSYCVCQIEQLAEMAATVLRQRLRTGAMITPVLDVQ